MKKFSLTPMRVAQIHAGTLSAHTVDLLRAHAEFKDTDPSLEEFIISTGTINEIVLNTKGKSKELCELNIDVQMYTYLHVIFI